MAKWEDENYALKTVNQNKETPNLNLKALRKIHSDWSKLNIKDIKILIKIIAHKPSSEFDLKFNLISTQLINPVISKKQDNLVSSVLDHRLNLLGDNSTAARHQVIITNE